MDGEVRVDPSPFDLGRGRVAVLCLHGLTGTPYEVRPLGEAFAAAGLRAVGPALPGHNETPEALAHVGSWQEWVDTARREVRRLAQEHERVCAAGLSMGGLVSLVLAAERSLDALVVVGTPLRFDWSIRLAVPWLKRFVPFLDKNAGSDIQDEAARRRHPSYPRMPLAAVDQLLGLQAAVRRQLRQVVAPLLVAHGALDRTANPRDAEVIHDGVASRERALLMLPRSGHVVPVDRDGPELARAATDFLNRHAEGSR